MREAQIKLTMAGQPKQTEVFSTAGQTSGPHDQITNMLAVSDPSQSPSSFESYPHQLPSVESRASTEMSALTEESSPMLSLTVRAPSNGSMQNGYAYTPIGNKVGSSCSQPPLPRAPLHSSQPLHGSTSSHAGDEFDTAVAIDRSDAKRKGSKRMRVTNAKAGKIKSMLARLRGLEMEAAGAEKGGSDNSADGDGESCPQGDLLSRLVAQILDFETMTPPCKSVSPNEPKFLNIIHVGPVGAAMKSTRRICHLSGGWSRASRFWNLWAWERRLCTTA